jgi:tRNA A-37 threonylcarbamoyl transferase component Bud32
MSNPEIDESLIIAEIKSLLPGLTSISELDESFGQSASHVKTAIFEGVDVAIKPFKYFAKERAEHEALMLDMVQSIGIPTLKPLSLNLAKFGNYLVTKFDYDIDPLDQVVCGNCPSSRLDFIASAIGKTLNSLHDSGIVHGDCQLKNLFINTEDEVGMVDFEQADLVIGERDRDFYSGCSYDIETISASAEEVMCSPHTDEFIDTLKNSYFSSDRYTY